jgi:hypothetical protein
LGVACRPQIQKPLEELSMKKTFLTLLFTCLLAIAAQAQTPAASPPAVSPGNVSRVIYYDVLPGKTNEFTRFIRTNTVPILEEQKKQGLILNYGFFSKPTTEGPGDWDLGLVITWANYADAIDANPDRAAKADAITLKHYGSADARTKANDSTSAMRTVVSNMLIRGMVFNPMPK